MFSNSQSFYSNGNKYHVTMSYGDSTQFDDDTEQLFIHVLCKTTKTKYCGTWNDEYCDTWNDKYGLRDFVTNKQLYEVFSNICKSNNKKNYKYKLDFYPFEDYVSIRVNIKNKKGIYGELFDFVVNVKNDYEIIQQPVPENIYPITINKDVNFSICSTDYETNYYVTFPSNIETINVDNQINSWTNGTYQYNILNLHCLIFFKKLNSLTINNFIYSNFNIIPKLNIQYLTIKLIYLFGSTPSHVFDHFGVVKPNNSNNNGATYCFKSFDGIEYLNNLLYLKITTVYCKVCIINALPNVLNNNKLLKRIDFEKYISLTHENEWIEYCKSRNIKLILEK
jgi:hypothetical protein